MLTNEEPDSFLSRGLEKSIDQSDLECCESTSSNDKKGSNSENSIRHIDSINMPYLVTQGTSNDDNIKSEHLYSASANEIDEKKPKLKNLPQNTHTFMDTNLFPLLSHQNFLKMRNITSASIGEKKRGNCLENVKAQWKQSVILILPNTNCSGDQEKTTFTFPYGTFSYGRMPFGLSNLDRMLARCEETNLVLNWEKCHFMVKEGIVLGHKISGAGIEVDRAKIDVIAKLPYPTNVKGVRSFLGHAGFYRRFIKDFSMVSKPMTQLLMKDAKLDFFDDCKKAFYILKEKLTTAPIIISLDWNEPFELMCDASNFAVGAVLGQRIDGKFKPIYYASKTLNNAQEHYTTTKKELLAVVFSFDNKEDAKPRLIRDQLRLPEELSGVHDTFHVSTLKKCLADASLHVPLKEIKVDKTLRFIEEPVEILDREVRRLKRSKISLVKVRWNSKRGPEFTWEREEFMKSKYPQLFVDRADESAN
ncbi:reverse transcriptase domain-containing protein [Tanacetum coccineum]